MRLDDFAADRQAQSKAGWFRRHEWLEQPLRYLGRNSRTGVAHLDLHRANHGVRRNRKFAPLAVLHRLHRIAHQIDDHLSDLHSVDRRGANCIIKSNCRCHLLMPRADETKSHRFLDNGVEFLRPPLRAALCHVVAQPANDFARACCLLADAIDDLPARPRSHPPAASIRPSAPA